ncbi:MAG: DUF1595 domain-containing protein [Lentisphaeraceae bacterium]|nr:DUF1595 domain-containing protein [Lentisphaeraceae bacterium]
MVLEGKSSGLAQRLDPKTLYLDKLPYLFIDWVEIEGPQKGPWPPKSMETYFPSGFENTPQTEATVTGILKKLIPRAFRRPLKSGEVETFLGLFRNQLKAGNEFNEALKVVITAVLCSPDFLYIFEPNETGKKRQLTGFELASRLSYFLWSSLPDEELFALADSGELLKPAVLQKQFERMFADKKLEIILFSHFSHSTFDKSVEKIKA